MSLKIKNTKKFILMSVVALFVSILFFFLFFTIIGKLVQLVGGMMEPVPTPFPSNEIKNEEEAKPSTAETDYNSILLLVNKDHGLPQTYVPADLMTVALTGVRETQLRAEATGALGQLFQAAADQGLTLKCCSGYRSYETQEALYAENVAAYGEEQATLVSAKAGQSEHQSGLAMDVTADSVDNELVESFGETAEGQWLAQNAHTYGFIIRFPKDKTNITGYAYEPWHVRYVGKEAAEAIYAQGSTLEEYLASQKEE